MAKARDTVTDAERRASPRVTVRRARRSGLSDEAELERALELHRRLEWAMERADVSDVEVAAGGGVHGDYVRNLARGGAKHPSFFIITQIAGLLDVSPFWLAQMTEDPDDFRPHRTAPGRAAKKARR